VHGLVETYRQYLKSLEPVLGSDSGPITMARLAKEAGEVVKSHGSER
jgi:hypothetical protein